MRQICNEEIVWVAVYRGDQFNCCGGVVGKAHPCSVGPSFVSCFPTMWGCSRSRNSRKVTDIEQVRYVSDSHSQGESQLLVPYIGP